MNTDNIEELEYKTKYEQLLLKYEKEKSETEIGRQDDIAELEYRTYKAKYWKAMYEQLLLKYEKEKSETEIGRQLKEEQKVSEKLFKLVSELQETIREQDKKLRQMESLEKELSAYKHGYEKASELADKNEKKYRESIGQYRDTSDDCRN